MKNLKHRNIVGYVESFFDEAEDMFVIVMECCEYGDFAKIIKRKKFLG
jgi:serine/threonine protein kinase